MAHDESQICTLAIGPRYRAMASRLALDLARFALGRRLLVGTDRVADFANQTNVRAFLVRPSGRWHCYSDKRKVLTKALSTAAAAIHIDADTRVTGPLPWQGPWPPGLSAPHESLLAHLERHWPSNVAGFREAARRTGSPIDEALWIGESIYVLARQGGRERRFIEEWGVLARLLDDAGFKGGEGNVMGLAAAKAGLGVQWGRWSELARARRHLNASAASGRELTSDDSETIIRHGPKKSEIQESSEAQAGEATGKARSAAKDRQKDAGPILSRDGRRSRDAGDSTDARDSSHARNPADEGDSPHARDSADAGNPAHPRNSSDSRDSAHARNSADVGHVIKRKRPRISIVIVSRNEGRNLRATVDSFLRTLPSSAEIVVLDDGSTDGSAEFLSRRKSPVRLLRSGGLGVTKARNHGARQSRGEVVVFADAHVEPPPGWLEPLLSALGGQGVGAAAPATAMMDKPDRKAYGLRLTDSDLSTEWLSKVQARPYPAAILPGCFLAMPRDVFAATGGFDEGMHTWGMSDIEMSVRMWLLGYKLLVVPTIAVPHLFRKKHPYQVRWKSFLHNKARLAFVHFGEERIARVFDSIRKHSEFPAAMALLARGDANERRKTLLGQRRRDDDWYFDRFCGGLEI
jgi:GT2 family glycosyltransferase